MSGFKLLNKSQYIVKLSSRQKNFFFSTLYFIVLKLVKIDLIFCFQIQLRKTSLIFFQNYFSIAIPSVALWPALLSKPDVSVQTIPTEKKVTITIQKRSFALQQEALFTTTIQVMMICMQLVR